MREMMINLIRQSDREDGQALAEYALVLAFIAIVCVVAVTALGLAISGAFGSIAGGF
jgi:pilus assembly protein Flp/PilA